MFTLDAKTGALNMNFGTDGIADLDTPEITHGGGGIRVTTPPIVYKNFIIVGSSLPGTQRPRPGGRCARLRHP